MEYNFKKFESKNIRQEHRITITKSNQIGMPTKFYQDNKIKEFKYVVLFFDEMNKAIGIHFTNNEKEENRFKIIHSKKYGGSIIARSFFKTYNIDPMIYHGRYEYEKSNIEGIGKMFIVKLKKKKIKNKII